MSWVPRDVDSSWDERFSPFGRAPGSSVSDTLVSSDIAGKDSRTPFASAGRLPLIQQVGARSALRHDIPYGRDIQAQPGTQYTSRPRIPGALRPASLDVRIMKTSKPKPSIAMKQSISHDCSSEKKYRASLLICLAQPQNQGTFRTQIKTKKQLAIAPVSMKEKPQDSDTYTMEDGPPYQAW